MRDGAFCTAKVERENSASTKKTWQRPQAGGAVINSRAQLSVKEGAEGGRESGGRPIAIAVARSSEQQGGLSCSRRSVGRRIRRTKVGLLGDKMPRTVGFVNCFLRVPVVCLPCHAAFCHAAKVSCGNSQKKGCAISMYEAICHLVCIRRPQGVDRRVRRGCERP